MRILDHATIDPSSINSDGIRASANGSDCLITDPKLALTVDSILVLSAFLLFTLYHVWYYSWRWNLGLFSALLARFNAGYHRLDATGQHSRTIFVASVLNDAAAGTPNADMNLVVQATRNPITAASILGTGNTVVATTLINLLLDSTKMDKIRAISAADPLTGDHNLMSPEASLILAVIVLLLGFFALMQSLRLFCHVGYLARAAAFAIRCPTHPSLQGCDALELETSLNSCLLRAQTFFSIGLRCLYGFLPCVLGVFGGTAFFLSTLLLVLLLFFLDHI
jgi:hypothetical protein